MITGSAIQVTLRQLLTLLFVALVCLSLPATASAVQWRDLAQTDRHYVALEMTSLRLNASGRLTVWLRFTPRGEQQRKEAAREYDNKNYRLHLEFYEIDCGEQSAVLKLIDILGINGKRLARLPGGTQPDAIIPDSILDRAAQRACPVVEEVATDDDEETPDVLKQSTPDPADISKVPEENRLRIENALRRSKSDPSDVNSWIDLGNAYFDADLPKKAIEAYDQALRLNPKDTNVLNDQGAMYRESGDTTQALKCFERALAIDPGNLESLYNLGYMYAIDLNNISKGLEVWRRYLALDSTSEMAEQVRSFVKRYEKSQELR